MPYWSGRDSTLFMICWCAGLSLSELVNLEIEYKDQLETGRAQDPEFSSAVLKRIAPHKRRAELREIHSMLVSRQLVNGKKGAKQGTRTGWRDEVIHQNSSHALDFFLFFLLIWLVAV